MSEKPQGVPGFEPGRRICFLILCPGRRPMGAHWLTALAAPGRSPPRGSPRCRPCTPKSCAGTLTDAPVPLTGVRGCRRFGRGPPSGPKAIRAQPPAILWFLSDRSERNSPFGETKIALGAKPGGAFGAEPSSAPRPPGRDPTSQRACRNVPAGGEWQKRKAGAFAPASFHASTRSK